MDGVQFDRSQPIRLLEGNARSDGTCSLELTSSISLPCEKGFLGVGVIPCVPKDSED